MSPATFHHRAPFLPIWVGLVGLAVCEALLLVGVQGWWPGTSVSRAGDLMRENMTPAAWCCYLLILLGLWHRVDGAPFMKRFRNRFIVCWLWSVIAWCYFDWMNFYFMTDPATGLRAWEYINLPITFGEKVGGYLFAFGAIAPAMFLSAELLRRLGLGRLRSRGLMMPRWLDGVLCVIGAALCVIPILVGTPASNLALWLGTALLLDPINRRLGRPSILGDWSRGYLGRTVALGAGGLLCGFLWEFWNYWATTKWVYHLPFLGRWEHLKYFEMPLPGLSGFIAFGIQTWVMWQSTLLLLAPVVEGESGLPADQTLAREMCF